MWVYLKREKIFKNMGREGKKGKFLRAAPRRKTMGGRGVASPLSLIFENKGDDSYGLKW